MCEALFFYAMNQREILDIRASEHAEGYQYLMIWN